MDRNGMHLAEAEDIKKRWQEYIEEMYKKDLHDPDNHDGVITPPRAKDPGMGSQVSSPKLMCIELVMSSSHLILCRPLFLLPSLFPSIRIFSNESVL